MAEVFISYSRKDRALVTSIHDALRDIGRDTWVDWEGIPPTTEWIAEIRSAIESCDNFVIVLSPESVTSEVCRLELEHAIQHRKRLIPIVGRSVAPGQVPAAVSSLNWIFFDTPTQFTPAFKLLVAALDTDFDWVRSHTRLLVRARQWESKYRDNALLLRGSDLGEAESWLASAPVKNDTLPTALHAEYIAASRANTTKRMRYVVSGVTIALVVSIVLAIVAFIQRQNAVENAVRADNNAETARVNESVAKENETKALISEAQAQAETRAALAHLYAGAASNAADDGRYDPALAFALYAVGVTRDHEKDRRVFPDAEDALHRATVNGSTLAQPGHSAEVEGVYFSSGGKRAVTTGADAVRVWEVEPGRSTGEQIQVLAFAKGDCLEKAFSPDLERLVCTTSSSSEARILDVRTGKILDKISIKSVTGDASTQRTYFTFSPIGELFAVSMDQKKTFPVSSRAKRKVFEGTSPKFTPDSRLLSTEVNGFIKIWDSVSGEESRTAEIPGRMTSWSADGKRAVIADARNSFLWELDSGTPLPLGDAVCTALRPDGARIAAVKTEFGDLNNPRVEVIDTSSKASTFSRRLEQIGTIRDCVFTPDGGSLITTSTTLGSPGYSLHVWSLVSQQPGPTLALHGYEFKLRSDATTAAMIPNFEGAYVELISLASRARVELPDQDKQVGAAVFGIRGDRLVTAGGNRWRVWDPQLGKRLLTAQGGVSIQSLAFSPDGKWIATSGRIASRSAMGSLWDAQSGVLAGNFPAGDFGLDSLAFTPDSRLIATAGYDQPRVRLWDVRTVSPLPPTFSAGPSSNLVSFSADGKRFAFGGEEIRIQGVSRSVPTEVAQITVPGDVERSDRFPENLALSPDGKSLVISRKKDVQLWREGFGWRRLFGAAGSESGSTAIGFSRDARQVLTAGTENTIRIWDLNSGDLLKTLYYATASGRGVLKAVTFNSDERYVYALADDWTLFRFPLFIEDLVSVSRKMAATVVLTDADCAKYLRQATCPEILTKH